MTMIRLEKLEGYPGFRIVRDNPDGALLPADRLVTLDWDYPGVASSFGWNMRDLQVMNAGYYGHAPCDHSGTDGTVNCPDCGYPAAAFIREAGQWLHDNVGATAEDPGYF